MLQKLFQVTQLAQSKEGALPGARPLTTLMGSPGCLMTTAHTVRALYRARPFRGFAYINPPDPPNNPIMQIPLLSLFYKRGNQSTGRSGNLVKITQLVRVGVRSPKQILNRVLDPKHFTMWSQFLQSSTQSISLILPWGSGYLLAVPMRVQWFLGNVLQQFQPDF